MIHVQYTGTYRNQDGEITPSGAFCNRAEHWLNRFYTGENIFEAMSYAEKYRRLGHCGNVSYEIDGTYRIIGFYPDDGWGGIGICLNEQEREIIKKISYDTGGPIRKSTLKEFLRDKLPMKS